MMCDISWMQKKRTGSGKYQEEKVKKAPRSQRGDQQKTYSMLQEGYYSLSMEVLCY